MVPLPCDFYDQEVTLVARLLLGNRLVRNWKGMRVAGIIVETEAYRGEEDLACHAKSGRTARNAVMYGPGGHAYVYFTYGMHWCFNVVTGAVDFPAAVLIRAIWPVDGLDVIEQTRGRFRREQWCNGPAKLCQALHIDGTLNGANLCMASSHLWIEEGESVADENVRTTPRIGIQSVPEPG
jgi:DNA-3-methyladenine glycosylase